MITRHAAIRLKARFDIVVTPIVEADIKSQLTDSNHFRTQPNGRSLYTVRLSTGAYAVAVYDPIIEKIVSFLPMNDASIGVLDNRMTIRRHKIKGTLKWQ